MIAAGGGSPGMSDPSSSHIFMGSSHVPTNETTARLEADFTARLRAEQDFVGRSERYQHWLVWVSAPRHPDKAREQLTSTQSEMDGETP